MRLQYEEEIDLFRDLFQYANAIFVTIQASIEYYEANGKEFPKNEWWKVMLLVRNFLGHAILASKNDALLDIIGQNIYNIYLLCGIDLQVTLPFDQFSIGTSHFSEDKHIPLKETTGELIAKLKSITFEDLKKGFEEEKNDQAVYYLFAALKELESRPSRMKSLKKRRDELELPK